ncbi:hypothetical protein [Salibacterium aidingense]|uniref:hypothetical protein n=1 Tax=Salibacterium aidingense TaxID=384933 RepID=UPI003BDDBC7C
MKDLTRIDDILEEIPGFYEDLRKIEIIPKESDRMTENTAVYPRNTVARVGETIVITSAHGSRKKYDNGDVITVEEVDNDGDVVVGGVPVMSPEYRVVKTPQQSQQARLNALTEAKISELFAICERLERKIKEVDDLKGRIQRNFNDPAEIVEQPRRGSTEKVILPAQLLEEIGRYPSDYPPYYSIDFHEGLHGYDSDDGQKLLDWLYGRTPLKVTIEPDGVRKGDGRRC